MFLLVAKAYATSEEGVHVWEFPVHHFPGPPWNPNQWYLWGHGATLVGGSCSDADVVGTPPGDDCFSFYGKAMQWSNWTPHLTSSLTKIHNSTKNCSGLVVGGFMLQSLKKASVLKQRTNPTYASTVAWCTVPFQISAGRFVKLGLGSTGFGSCPAHIGLEILACPAAAVCCCLCHPCWPSRMMRIGAANGHPHLLEFFCWSKLDRPPN